MKTTIQFDEEMTEVIEDIKENSDARSRGQVVGKAIRLLEFAIKQKKAGHKLYVRDQETHQDVEILV